jgi:hypothetical protein
VATYEAWRDPADGSVLLTTTDEAGRQRVAGLLSAASKLVWRFDAATWEEANAHPLAAHGVGPLPTGGTYETDESRHAVIHHVEADREPHVMGTDRTRVALVTGSRLVLRPVALPPGVAEWTVEWERVGVQTFRPRAP